MIFAVITKILSNLTPDLLGEAEKPLYQPCMPRPGCHWPPVLSSAFLICLSLWLSMNSDSQLESCSWSARRFTGTEQKVIPDRRGSFPPPQRTSTAETKMNSPQMCRCAPRACYPLLPPHTPFQQTDMPSLVSNMAVNDLAWHPNSSTHFGKNREKKGPICFGWCFSKKLFVSIGLQHSLFWLWKRPVCVSSWTLPNQ